MRIAKDEFRRKPLRAHALLADVPLHDVWAFRLKGGGRNRTVSDFQKILFAGDLSRTNRLVRGLFRLRRALGRVFGWDRLGEDAIASLSYVHRLTDDDRRRSLAEPGSDGGLGRVLYRFEYEGLNELINRTVHAFLLLAMEPAEDGYVVYLGVYVKKVSGLTPLYMSLIDPFRRIVLYPAMVRKLEGTWRSTYAAP